MLILCESLRGSIACIPRDVGDDPLCGEIVRKVDAEVLSLVTIEERLKEEACI
jgi:hypothetical protein